MVSAGVNEAVVGAALVDTLPFYAGTVWLRRYLHLEGPADGSDWRVIARSRTDELDASYVSVAEQITFPTTDDAEAHALFYAPRNAEFEGPDGERPPLVVMSHGGPTSATSSS